MTFEILYNQVVSNLPKNAIEILGFLKNVQKYSFLVKKIEFLVEKNEIFKNWGKAANLMLNGDKIVMFLRNAFSRPKLRVFSEKSEIFQDWGKWQM